MRDYEGGPPRAAVTGHYCDAIEVRQPRRRGAWRRTLGLLLVCVALHPAGARAEEEAEPVEDSEEVGHETIVIVGKRMPEPLSLASRSVSVIDEQALTERPPRTVPEALWDAPGVFVQHTNYGGGSPIVRGLIGPQNLILVDGVRLNNSVYRTGPLQYLNLLDPQSVARIEVLRGAGSVLYGSDAMGGVIQVTPVAARDCRGAGRPDGGGRALLRYSSADQGRIAHLRVDGGTAGLSALAGLTYKEFFDLSGGRGIGEQVHSGYGDLSGVGSLTYRFPAGAFSDWKVSAHYIGSEISDAGRTDKLFDKHSLQVYDNDDYLTYGRLHAQLDPIATKGDLTVSYQSFFERKDSISVADDLATHESATRDETEVDTIGLDLQLVSSLVADRLWLQYGGMLYRDWVDAERTTWTPGNPWQVSPDASYPAGSTYDNFGGFLLVEGDAVRLRDQHTVRLGGGYRLHGMSGQAPARDTLPRVDIDHLGHVFFASAHYLHLDNENVSLTFAQGFRAPNLNEAVMLGDTGKYFHVPNDDLGPERSDTVELAGQARIWRITAGLAGYVSMLHDLINVSADLGRGFSLAGSLAFTWGKEKVAGGPDEPLTRIPPLFGQLKLRYDRSGVVDGRIFVEGYVRAAGEQDRLSPEDVSDARIPPGGTPGWWTANLRFGYMTTYTTWALALENVANEAYKYHGSGVYAPGTNAMLSVEVHR